MGLKELEGGPFLPGEITLPLDQTCPLAPLQGPVRSILAMPMLPRVHTFLAKVAAAMGGSQPETSVIALHPSLEALIGIYALRSTSACRLPAHHHSRGRSFVQHQIPSQQMGVTIRLRMVMCVT